MFQVALERYLIQNDATPWPEIAPKDVFQVALERYLIQNVGLKGNTYTVVACEFQVALERYLIQNIVIVTASATTAMIKVSSRS